MRPATQLPIKKACPLEGDLPGSGAVRHCASCQTDVVDLSLLTAAAADRMLADPARPRCVSYRVDDDGNVVHLAAGPPPARRRLPLLVGGLLLAACNGSPADGNGPSPAPVAEVAAAASSSPSPPPSSSVPPAGSATPTEKRTRGELAAASPATSGEACAGEGAEGAVPANGKAEEAAQAPPKKPKKPKQPMMRGYM